MIDPRELFFLSRSTVSAAHGVVLMSGIIDAGTPRTFGALTPPNLGTRQRRRAGQIGIHATSQILQAVIFNRALR